MSDITAIGPDPAPEDEPLIRDLQLRGVTSIVIGMMHTQGASLMTQAPKIGYQPEWLSPGRSTHEFESGWQRAPADQSTHLFGLGTWNKTLPPQDSLWQWAAVESGVDPSQIVSYPVLSDSYRAFLILASGIQMAGPNLTAETFGRALQTTRFPNANAGAPPYYQATVGFRGDHTMVYDAGLVWWGPAQQSYANSTAGVGAWCYVGSAGGGGRARSTPAATTSFAAAAADPGPAGSAQRSGSIVSMSWALGRPPVIRARSSPSSKRSRAGMPLMSKRSAISLFESTSTFAIRSLPSYSLAISSSVGASALHGPHHSAQKSTRTGGVSLIAASNVSVVRSVMRSEATVCSLVLPSRRTALRYQRCPIATAGVNRYCPDERYVMRMSRARCARTKDPMADTRTLRFPDGRKVGELMYVDAGERKTMPAKGAVEVPSDAQAMLMTMPPHVPEGETPPEPEDGFVAGDLEPLAALEPDALQGVYAGNVTAGAAKHIAHLTALQTVALMGEPSDDDLAIVASLPNVSTFSGASTTATGTGLAGFAAREEMGLVQISLPGLTAEGAATLAAMKASMLFVSGPAFTAELLDGMPPVQAKEFSLNGPEVDRAAFLRLIERSPSVKAVGARAGGGPVIDPETEMTLRQARPDMTINGTWLGAKAVAKLVAARAAS